MAELPRGTVTLLFTDIEGSTRLLQDLGEQAYVRALEDHRRLLRQAFTAHGGVEVEMQGDSFHFAFADPCAAVLAATRAQGALAEHAWEVAPIRVRIGIHTGEPLLTGHLYAGLDVHRAARVMSAGHGGQVLVSERTSSLVHGRLPDGLLLRDLGEHRLKDLSASQRLYQLGEEEFPPLHNLAFVRFQSGRELEAVSAARESLEISHRFGDVKFAIFSLLLLGALAMRLGNAKAGATLVSAAEAERARVGLSLGGTLEGELHDRTLHDLREALGTEALDAALAEGASLDLDGAGARRARSNPAGVIQVVSDHDERPELAVGLDRAISVARG